MLLVELFLMWVGCWVGDRSSGVFKRRGIGSAHQSSPSLLTIGQWNVTSGSPISSSKKRWGYGGGRERETHREREKERECVCMWVLLLKIKKVFSCSTKQPHMFWLFCNNSSLICNPLLLQCSCLYPRSRCARASTEQYTVLLHTFLFFPCFNCCGFFNI